jgi:diaminohydroxyphosphoribosylaminopyrimidine deaminase/5-amino-6-(5-phosphoribosylamino)uracil reductase
LKAITTGLPFVLYKAALTLDGKTAVASGDSRWVTSEISRQYAHRLRNRYDVIMAGSRTILQDDPQLTCRGMANGRDPVRLIVDGTLALPLNARVIDSSPAPCILATTQAAAPAKIDCLREKENVEVWQYPTARYVPLKNLMADIARRGWNSVLLEGGGILAGQMLAAKLVDKIEFIYAPKLSGSGPSPLSGLHLAKMADACPVRELTCDRLGDDYHLVGYPDYRENL